MTRPTRKDIILQPAGTDVADPLNLEPGPRLFMLAWLRGQLGSGPINVDDWREAYGRAADYQTALNARIVLTRDEVAA